MKCNRCKSDKDESEFSFKNKVLNLRNSYCKPCHRSYTKEHYRLNAKLYKSRARRSNIKMIQKHKRFVRDLKSELGCFFCGETDYCCLDFHHLTDKTFNISRSVHLSLENVLTEILKCLVLCSNCHRKLHAGRFQVPHEGFEPSNLILETSTVASYVNGAH